MFQVLVVNPFSVGGKRFFFQNLSENASIRETLAAEVALVNNAGIPRDIVFDFAW